MNNLITNYIFEYYDAITSGRIRAGKWIKLVYKKMCIRDSGCTATEEQLLEMLGNKEIKFDG